MKPATDGTASRSERIHPLGRARYYYIYADIVGTVPVNGLFDPDEIDQAA
jgi:hypothetical protein